MARGWLREIPANSKWPKGAWQPVYVGSDGRQHSRMFDHNQKRVAQRWLDHKKAEVDRDEWRDPAAGKVSFEDWAEQWLTQQTWRDSTRRVVTGKVRNHLIPAFGRTPLKRITTAQVQSWVRGLARDGLADSTICEIYHQLGVVLMAAVDADVILRSPCRRVRLPRGRPRRRPVILDSEQAATLITVTRPVFRPLLVVGLATGMRYGELAGLTRGRVDLLRREANVEQQRQLSVVGPVKTPSSVRVLPLPEVAVATLAAAIPAGSPADWLVLRGVRGGPLSRSSVSQSWHVAAEAAGVPGFTAHDMRRTYASWLEDAGIPRAATRMLLGHALDEDTTGRYIRPLPEVWKRVVAVLDDRLPGPDELEGLVGAAVKGA
jgi:integrase